jgi:hypothetical protein
VISPCILYKINKMFMELRRTKKDFFLEIKRFLYFHSFGYSLIYDYYFEFEFLPEQ